MLIPVLAAVAMLPIRGSLKLCKQLALGATIANLALSLVLWGEFDGNSSHYQNLQVLSYLSLWQINLGVDGLSLIFVFLTCFIMPCCILASWNSAPLTSKRSCRDLAQSGGDQGIKAELRFLLALLLVETLLIALFLVVDLLLFYICYESVLIPLFLMIGLWGSGQQKVRAAFMLFLYTLFGSLFMLVSFITIYLASGSTDILVLSHMYIEPSAQRLLWLGIFLALAIKTPLLPLHIWLPLAHTEAPLAGSILLAALVLKMPIYAFLRILLPILPDGSHYFTPLVYTLCVISIVYSCFSTLRQINLKSIVAYSSIGHLAICVLGVFSNSVQGIEGGIYLGLGHGLVSPALFICVGILYDRYHSLIIHYYRGVAAMKPVFAFLFFIFILANMAAPLTANFIGEFLCFLGSFHRNPAATLLATSSVVLVASYSIWLYNRVCFGSFSPYLKPLSDLNRREFYVLLPLLVLTILLGIISNIVLDCLHVPVSNLLYDTSLFENTPPRLH
jgi:NADH-ubiquinone oxidoreductase chain 4